jgi:uncharacterized membrane protein
MCSFTSHRFVTVINGSQHVGNCFSVAVTSDPWVSKVAVSGGQVLGILNDGNEVLFLSMKNRRVTLDIVSIAAADVVRTINLSMLKNPSQTELYSLAADDMFIYLAASSGIYVFNRMSGQYLVRYEPSRPVNVQQLHSVSLGKLAVVSSTISLVDFSSMELARQFRAVLQPVKGDASSITLSEAVWVEKALELLKCPLSDVLSTTIENSGTESYRYVVSLPQTFVVRRTPALTRFSLAQICSYLQRTGS